MSWIDKLFVRKSIENAEKEIILGRLDRYHLLSRILCDDALCTGPRNASPMYEAERNALKKEMCELHDYFQQVEIRKKMKRWNIH